MLHCANTLGDMTVLERMKWQEEEAFCSGFSSVFCSSSSSSSLHVHDSIMLAADSGSALAEVVAQAHAHAHVSPSISRTFSCPPTLVEPDPKHKPKPKPTDSSIGIKKRKPDNPKFVAENDSSKDKRIKVGADDGESKITGHPNREEEDTKQNSKVSDYIHVRARRGQATDSHSLAERVRREKISERMKYLQDLVPGCNKITGKAGMLDEIINYVQSLQRQVEFLSMKLAAVNPRLDFSVDDLFHKEVFPACSVNFPNMGVPSDITNYLQFDLPQQQQIASYGGLVTGINPSDMGLRRTISAPVSMPETYLHSSSCFTQTLPSSTWEGDFQNICNFDFDQARPPSFPSQFFSGLVEAGNLKMEM